MKEDKVIENGLAAIDEVSDLVWKLIQTRKAKGITQKQVAEYMGTRVSDVARFEDMLAIPKVKTVILYAAAIGEKIGIDKTASIEKPIGLDEPIDWEHPAKKYKDITLGEAHAICNEHESCLNCPLSIETKNRRSYCFCLACSDEDGKDYKEVMDKLIQL